MGYGGLMRWQKIEILAIVVAQTRSLVWKGLSDKEKADLKTEAETLLEGWGNATLNGQELIDNVAAIEKVWDY